MQKAVIVASRENKLSSLARVLSEREIETTVLMREDVNSITLLADASEKAGKVDFLILSALCDKTYEGKNLAELTTEEYRTWKYYALRQFYEISATFVKKMEAHGGKVLGVISEAGVVPSLGMCMNGGAGAALAMGLQCMAAESFEYGIYTNTVAIGATDGESRFMRDDESYLLHVPSKALMSENDIAEKIANVLLLTDDKMTGNVLTLDAGFSCAYMREW